MRRTSAAESNPQPATGREAKGNASRPSPLALVSGAVAGADLATVTATASEARGRPLAIAIPALGEPIVHPVGALAEAQVTEIYAYALACVNGTAVSAPAVVGDAVPIRIGEQMVGIAVDVRMVTEPGTRSELGAAEQRAWLEAAAAAASVTALMRDLQEGLDGDGMAELLVELSAAPPEDLGDFLTRARRMGFELASGATAICAEARVQGSDSAPIPSPEGVLLADTGRGFLLGLIPTDSGCSAEDLAAELRSLGFTVAISGPRREPDAFHDALREARLLVQLATASDVALGDQDDTYRLLIGVLLRDRDELILLRDRTISPLADYDARHNTEFLSTLQAFLAHDGSTTETAEAMQLHRHTVGYRLSRVHEISGLSPYESDGRERLGLGLKSDQILAAAAACNVGADGHA